jgi:hypothetical protein
MRTALFSDKEREMVEHFLKTGEKGEGFRVLAYRVRKSKVPITEDYELMIRLLTKMVETKNESL